MINKSGLAFMQVYNFKFLFEIAMLFYYLGNIAFRTNFIWRLNAIDDDLKKDTAFTISESGLCLQST